MALGRVLLDTSVLVAVEVGRPLSIASPLDEATVSVITVGELRAGVLSAASDLERVTRLATLERALTLEPLPVDRAVAESWAGLRTALRNLGRRLPINDSWIAATAMAHSLPILTQDDDYDDVPGLSVIRV